MTNEEIRNVYNIDLTRNKSYLLDSSSLNLVSGKNKDKDKIFSRTQYLNKEPESNRESTKQKVLDFSFNFDVQRMQMFDKPSEKILPKIKQ